MGEVCCRVALHADPAEVWRVLTDFESLHTWFFGVRSVRVLSPRLGTGARRVLTLNTGKKHLEEVAEWVEGRRYTIEVKDPPVFAKSWRGIVELESSHATSSVIWRLVWTVKLGRAGVILDHLLVVPVLWAALWWSLRRLRRQLGSMRKDPAPSREGLAGEGCNQSTLRRQTAQGIPKRDPR